MRLAKKAVRVKGNVLFSLRSFPNTNISFTITMKRAEWRRQQRTTQSKGEE